ncbi:MAG: hypothetical protein JWN40_2368 [Phycisphaerales bacterium]|nr:hypothetical protein [Phycisphaerales bacterium]
MTGRDPNAKLTGMVALAGKPDLLDRLFRTGDANLSTELAAFILGLDFDASERERIDGLAGKSNSGTLTSDERAEYEWYVLIGDLLSLLQIKARASLKKHQPAA